MTVVLEGVVVFDPGLTQFETEVGLKFKIPSLSFINYVLLN